MITIYRKHGGNIEGRELGLGVAIPDDLLWIDMLSPSNEELDMVERHLGVQIPSKHEVWKNHVLNRLYIENNIAYMTAAIITKVEGPYPNTSAVTFILAPNYLLTVRHIDPTSFRDFTQRIQRPNENFSNASNVLEGLLEEIITRVAYNSEKVSAELDQLSHDIFGSDVLEDTVKNPSQLMKNVLKRLGASADLNSKINESLHSINRMLCFFRQVVHSNVFVSNNVDILLTDVQALTKQTDFLSDKINFQLDATLGMVNVEQNLIIKIFSVVAVFFLPPTLVSSIYGMNFRNMPELEWFMGYPMAVGIMVLCGLIPYLYFRKRGWL